MHGVIDAMPHITSAKVLTGSSKLLISCSKDVVENSKEHVTDANTFEGNSMR